MLYGHHLGPIPRFKDPGVLAKRVISKCRFTLIFKVTKGISTFKETLTDLINEQMNFEQVVKICKSKQQSQYDLDISKSLQQPYSSGCKKIQSNP
jgi:hypothetical protein